MPRGYLDEDEPEPRKRRRRPKDEDPPEPESYELPAYDLESLLTEEWGFALTTATNLQRAICRAADGLPMKELWRSVAVRKAFGERPPVGVIPDIMLVLAAIRSAKSMIAAAKVVACSQTVDLTGTKPGDEIRIPVLSTDKDAARATFTHISGAIQSSPTLRKLLVGPPKADSLLLRHPTGTSIEVKVTALSRYGSTVVSRWLAGMIFDEAPRIGGEDDAVRNLEESERASRGRMLPGAQTWIIGSPWEPSGPVYDRVIEHEGHPNADCVVIRAPGPAMNPVRWTKEKCEELRKRDPKAYRTDVLAQFADADDALFASQTIESAMRESDEALEPKDDELAAFVAVLDPGSMGPNWRLLVLGNYGKGGPGLEQPLMRVAMLTTWVAEQGPVNPDQTLRAVTKALKPYKLDEAVCMRGTADMYSEFADRHGLTLIDETGTNEEHYRLIKRMLVPLSHGTLELSPDRTVRQSLVGIKKRAPGSPFKPPPGFAVPLAIACENCPELPELDEHDPDPIYTEHMNWLNQSGEDAVDDAAERLFR